MHNESLVDMNKSVGVSEDRFWIFRHSTVLGTWAYLPKSLINVMCRVEMQLETFHYHHNA